ncbi:MAG: hypothetical protein GZ090_01485 [Oxalobacteraceae bacterium]|nr:hypothetical protein [Oxalobacteraceae bacterium]
MEISNNDIARILGNIESKVDAQMKSSERHEKSLLRLEIKLTERVDGHEQRLRVLEVANPQQIAEDLAAHEKRIRSLEHGAAKAGVISGVGSAVGMAVIIEIAKRKLGL